MDVLLFVKIIAWIVAIFCTFQTFAGIAFFVYREHTTMGQLEAIGDRMRGFEYKLRWQPAVFATIAWVAIYCFR